MNLETKFEEIQKTGLASRKLIDGPATLTYGELNKRSRKLAAFLKNSGFESGDRIAIAVTDDVEVATIFLSCLRAGVSVLLIDPAAKKTEASEIIRRAKIKGIFIDQELVDPWALQDSIPHIWPVVKQKKKLISRLLGKKETTDSSLQNYPDCLAAFEGEGERIRFESNAERSSLLLCTSGTTGLPKILQLSCANLIAAAKTTSVKLRLNANARVLDLLPLTHYDGIISGLFTAFWNGAALIRLGPFSVPLLPEVFDAIYKYRCTHVLLTPSILALMMRLGEDIEELFKTEDFQFVISVAANLPPKLWSDFEQKTGKYVVNVYGLSETGNNLFAGPDEESHQIGTIGKPVDCRVLIVDENGQEAPHEEIGELLLDGASITSGYLEQPAKKITVDGVEWFATGDLAFVDPAGVFHLVGRKKNIIIVGGRNVYPDEVNNALLAHPLVAETATVGVPDEIWGERVVSCVVAKDGVSSQDLIRFASEQLSDYKVPREIHIVSDLPKGRSGKVLVNELIAQLQQGSLQKKQDAEARVEEQILQIASDSFRTPLNELSLATTPQSCSSWDSVAHMDFVIRLEEKFGVELLPREVIQITALEAAVRMIRSKLAS